MTLEIQGKLHEVYETQQVTEKFRKREFIVELDDNGYMQYIKFQLNQDRCTLIDNHKKGDEVKVSFNLSGRAYTTKTGETGYITNLVAWRIQPLGSAPQASVPEGVPAFLNDAPPAGADDLPF